MRDPSHGGAPRRTHRGPSHVETYLVVGGSQRAFARLVSRRIGTAVPGLGRLWLPSPASLAELSSRRSCLPPWSRCPRSRARVPWYPGARRGVTGGDRIPRSCSPRGRRGRALPCCFRPL